jgi:hypothetical protein
MQRDPMMDKDAAMQPSRPPQGLGAGMVEPPASPTTAAMPGQAPDQEGVPATPEEQAQYEQFVDNAMTLIYDEQTRPGVLQSLGGDDPVAALANTAAMVVLQVENAADDQGTELADGVVFNAGVAVLEDLAGLATEAGIHAFTEEETEAALYQALDIYREMKAGAGGIDQEQHAAELQALMQADQQGQLGQILPGVEQAAAKGRAPA